MDSTNGHSEENPQKKDKSEEAFDKFEIEQEGDFKKIDISELPWEEQERIRKFMEMTGDEEPPELFIADIKIRFFDPADIPMELLAHSYRDAIVDGEYEEAAELGEEIKKRGYSIEITEKLLTLKKIT